MGGRISRAWGNGKKAPCTSRVRELRYFFTEIAILILSTAHRTRGGRTGAGMGFNGNATGQIS